MNNTLDDINNSPDQGEETMSQIEHKVEEILYSSINKLKCRAGHVAYLVVHSLRWQSIFLAYMKSWVKYLIPYQVGNCNASIQELRQKI